MNSVQPFKGYRVLIIVVFVLAFNTTGTKSIVHLVWSAQETSKEGHTEQAPHNGQILDTGEKHVEFLVKGGKEVFVYFYDKNLKPLSVEGVEGTVYFKLIDNSKKESKLTPIQEKDTTYLKGNVDLGVGDYTEAVISLKIEDKRENLRFGHPTGQGHHQ
jgi:hypothetical protein